MSNDYNFGSLSKTTQNFGAFRNSVDTGKSKSEINSNNIWQNNNMYRTSYFTQSMYNVIF